MTPQSMSEVIEALEGKGLIKRDQHPNHRRVYPAQLTATGIKVLEACDEAVGSMEEDMLREWMPTARGPLRRPRRCRAGPARRASRRLNIR